MPKNTVSAILNAATEQLEMAGISTARLDALVLLEDILNTNRAQLLAHSDLELTKNQQKKLDMLVQQRARHEPLAYIRNRTEFYGREFYIDHHVLEPRSESEAMIDVLKTRVQAQLATIIDVGTGSGALAITAKLEFPNSPVMAIDIDEACLVVARKNAEQWHANIRFLKSNLLAELAADELQAAVLLCNLPYVPDDFHINQAATHEPRLAIFGGVDGLDVYRLLFSQLTARHMRPHFVITESLPPQHPVLTQIAHEAGFVLATSDDFIQVFKMAADHPGS